MKNSMTLAASFSPTEINAMRLNGELFELLEDSHTLDFVPHFLNRLALASSRLPAQAVLDRLGAAWVYGAVPKITCKYFSAIPGGRLKAENFTDDSVTNRIIPSTETLRFGNIHMTTPRRTVADLAFYAVTKTTSQAERTACYLAIPALVSGFRLDFTELIKNPGLTPRNSNKQSAQTVLRTMQSQIAEPVLFAEVEDVRLSHFVSDTHRKLHRSV